MNKDNLREGNIVKLKSGLHCIVTEIKETSLIIFIDKGFNKEYHEVQINEVFGVPIDPPLLKGLGFAQIDDLIWERNGFRGKLHLDPEEKEKWEYEITLKVSDGTMQILFLSDLHELQNVFDLILKKPFFKPNSQQISD